MKKFEYEITSHPAKLFTDIVVFCSEKGECSLEEVPHDQSKRVEDVLNARGSQGWELVTLHFGKDGMIAFWKRGVE